jgi:Bacterial Ig-like domain (group 1)
MSTHLRPSRRWLGGLALVLVGLLSVLGWASTARAADDYSVSLQTPDLIRQFEDVELTAVVKDSQGQPVNGIPVIFQVAPDWKKDTTLEPIRTLTRDGIANTVFQADMPGVVRVTVQAGNTSQTTHITVTGAGSRVYDKQP